MEEETETTGNTNNLVFAVNGVRFEISEIQPSTTLLEFLRSQTPFKSVKLGCGEGGCGACVVLLSKYNPVVDQVEDFSISSCLTLLCSVNGCSITTTEGLGNTKDGLHPIHQRFSGFHASQCGFCTPGMCISLFAAIVNADKTNRPQPFPGFSKLTVSEAENAITGNLCRCTGYRPIVDVCKSFASDVDMEDLGFNSFWKKGEMKEIKLSRLPSYKYNDQICTFPKFLKKEIRSTMVLDPKRFCWYTPVSINNLQSLLESSKADSCTSMKLVVGNTGTGYFKELGDFDKYIDIRYIPELSMIKRDQTGIEIGAAVTISKVIEALREENGGERPTQGDVILKKIADHMEKVATRFIRNSASIGGNLVMAQRKQFPSDITTILLVVGTVVEIMNGLRCEKLRLEEFLERPPLDSNSALLSIKIPYCPPSINISSGFNGKLLFETYRSAPRPCGNALAYLNAALMAEVSPYKNSDKLMINNCKLAFGACGKRQVLRAWKAEEFLTEKLLNNEVLYEAIKLLRGIIVPDDDIPNPGYRLSLAVGFLFKFFSSLTDTADISKGWFGQCKSSLMLTDSNGKQTYGQFDDGKHSTFLMSGHQVFKSSKEYDPVGQPITKLEASIQASGEAVYVDDIPSPVNCLYGAFIYSTKPLARIKDIMFRTKSLPDGVFALISSKDIPEGGENIGAGAFSYPEPLFADGLAECFGYRIALVVADTQKHANEAAEHAVIDYNTENLELPVLSVEEAVMRSSFFEVPPFFQPRQIGDFSKGMAEADHKIISTEIRLGSQYYFYMEMQTALAVPDEDNCMLVYSSTQCPQFVQMTIARCLGVPEHNVRVITRRVGGGFGGKAMKSIPVAVACAVAAHKLRRPVRMYVNRKTDMIMAGGRHPMKITYSVGFRSDGKITALKLDILIDAGIAADISPILMPHNIINALKKYNWGALSFDIKVCKTNLPSRSAMRAPGELQGSFIAEAIIEHVASTLSIEVDSVRTINLHRFDSLNIFYEGSAAEFQEYTLPCIWDKLAMSSSFSKRSEMIKEFNRCNIWQKRGISRVPIVHEVKKFGKPGKVSILSDGSVVVEVGGIELGQGLWTKVKQMAAYGLSLIQCDATESHLLDKVRLVQADTLSMIQGGITAGSTTSESCCEAIRLCCNILVERLLHLKEKLLKDVGPVNWDTLIRQAYAHSTNLSASSYYVPESDSKAYKNYGAAVSEVEIDLLTGAVTILRADIIYDCGQSLNPAVDLGQVEGAFVQGIGFFMLEEYITNSDGLVVPEGTWKYKIPTVDTIPRQFNVELLNSGYHQKCILSSKASGEPPLLLAASVHCATRAAIKEARKQLHLWSSSSLEGLDSTFDLQVPATMPVVKQLCGLENVETYLKWKIGRS